MAGPTRLVQLDHPGLGRRAALVDGEELHLLGTYRSVYQFAQVTLETGYKLRDLLSTDLSGIVLDYTQVWALETEWRFLPSFDHPDDPGRCMVSGAQPAWYYKGNGLMLYGHGEPLPIPEFATEAAEQASIAAVYIIDQAGAPRRVGLAAGNELCDATGTAADSKLYPCSIGPELWLEAKFEEIRGSVTIRRDGERLWSTDLVTGERQASSRLEEIEARLFRHACHRRPGDVHIHFLGSAASAQQHGIRLQPEDEMVVSWDGFGRPLANRVGRGAVLTPAAALPL